MATFPTIYRRGTELHSPVVGDFEDTMAHDPAIRSQSEGGYVTSRARFTRIARKWIVNYTWMSKANARTNPAATGIKAFEDARAGGSDNFDWPNPDDGVTYDVRFLGLVRYIPHENTNFLWWMVEFVLEEV